MVIQLKEINSGMPQDSVLELTLYLLSYTADLPIALDYTAAIYADTAILATHNNHIEESLRLYNCDYTNIKVSITSRGSLKNGVSNLTEQNQYR